MTKNASDRKDKQTRLILSIPYKITSADTDMNLRLRMSALSNLLIQSAINSAETLRAGFLDLEKQNLFWVLSRMTIEIDKPLVWNDSLEVETWPKDVKKIFYLRDFLVRNNEQNIVAKATSGWLAIDKLTKRPQTLKQELSDIFSELKDRHAINALPEKLFPVKEGEISELKTTYYDIDLNGHVTSIRYIDWMMDTFPVEFHKNNYPKKVSINYQNETRINETVQITRNTIDGKTFLFEGINRTRNLASFHGKIFF
ncbi:MAG TPA: hypothetical protein DD381_10485 [Lentisphaeria bacterium]|nr:MAG: hypothetical protein A2X47_02185 [Lentisphaerae bacterium GWF2_38_69]HBM16753.1 hypothetical protein [Lentisphaeria bacterium]